VGVLGVGLSATRIIGVLAVGAVGVDFLGKKIKEKRLDRRAVIDLLLIGMGVSGLVAYMIYLGGRFGDPLLFSSVQSSFGSGRDTSHLVLLPQVFFRYAKMFYYGLPWDLKTYAIVQELTLSLIYLGGLVMTGWRNYQMKKEIYPWSWWLFSVGAYLVPPLTGNLSSMTRYTLVCLVVVVAAGRFFAKRGFYGVGLLSGSGVIMLINLLLFVQGFWVA
jgi:hypothetical protein